MLGWTMWLSMSSSRLSMSMRFIATVTISVSEAKMDFSINSLELNFPVPRNRREVNVLLEMVKFCMMFMVCLLQSRPVSFLLPDFPHSELFLKGRYRLRRR